MRAPLSAQSNKARFQKFSINFDEESLADLHRRLKSAGRAPSPFDEGWSSGTDDLVLWDLVNYWLNRYDWPAALAKLNELEQYRGSVGGEQVQFAQFVATGTASADLSDAPRAPGLNPTEIAKRMHEPMPSLWFERYGVQG